MPLADAGPVLRAAGDGDLETLSRVLEQDRTLANALGANPPDVVTSWKCPLPLFLNMRFGTSARKSGDPVPA